MPRPRIETRRSTDRTGSGAGACTDLSWPARAARGATTWCPRGPGWHPEEAWILGGDGGEEVRRRSGKQRKQDLRVPSGVRARGGARTGRRRCTRGRTSLEMGCATCRRVRAPEGSLGVSPSGVIAVPRGPILARFNTTRMMIFRAQGLRCPAQRDGHRRNRPPIARARPHRAPRCLSRLAWIPRGPRGGIR